MGGDGLHAELLAGLAAHKLHATAVAALRIGHIPAGSTDAVACTCGQQQRLPLPASASPRPCTLPSKLMQMLALTSTFPPLPPPPSSHTHTHTQRLHGTRNALTAALHVAFGDATPLDMGYLQPLTPLMRSCALQQQEQQQQQQQLLLPQAPESPGYASNAYSSAACDAHARDGSRGAPGGKQFVCAAHYGYLADVLRASEALRWMGPARYAHSRTRLGAAE